MLKNTPTLAIVAVHTEENEPPKVWKQKKFIISFVSLGTKRPLAHNSRGEPSWLFHCLEGEECGLDARDVKQGSLGDCYFLSALALVATDTCCADGLVDDALDASGCYGVSFWVQGAWQMVWVRSEVNNFE